MQNVSLRKAPKELPIRETYSTNPKDTYAFSKVIGENIANFYAYSYGMNTAVIRPPWIAFPKDYDVHLGFINGGKSGGERGQSAFPFSSFNTHAWVDVRDLANAYRIVLQKNKSFAIYNVNSDDSTLNLPLSEVYKGQKSFENFNDLRSALSNEKIKDLGFLPFYNRSHLL